ncbi:hypothetical protein [Flavobacterium sp.]|uniref:hypothetical protein n=1 Tax=Flavobacterium sp. TaxID=239 RepID=UPI002CBB8679|nr:hypothetical protein [Flavobacterium sp.]HSD07504.1 hypothetical protein [Flavobacterium sp.]
MKNLLMVLALALGTTVMMSAQTTPTQTAPSKEVKATKKEHKKEAKKEVKAEEANKTTSAATPSTVKK